MILAWASPDKQMDIERGFEGLTLFAENEYNKKEPANT